MKLHYLDRSSLTDSSYTVKENHYPYFLKVWHFHPELELVFIKESNGTRFIGDNISPFEAGELVLIGENLPHMWQNHDSYFAKDSNKMATAIGIHFKKDFLGSHFFEIPEMKHISRLFEKAKLGIRFEKPSAALISKIEKLLDQGPFEKTVSLIEILNELSQLENIELLSSDGYSDSFQHIDNENMVKTYEYVYKNFTKSIYLKDVADLVHMNPASFSRFFKRINQKTFSRFLNEVRVGYACKLMIENPSDITSICFESGYNNISNFNRQFKTIKGMSPSNYIKLHHRSKS